MALGAAKLGAAKPTVLSLDNGIEVDRIAALKPDLIVAANAGVDAPIYQQLSANAPTIPQSGPAPFFEPWKDQANAIAQAMFQPQVMTALINKIYAKFTGVANSYPQFQGKKILSLQGSTYWQNSAIAAMPSWKPEWINQMGFVIPSEIDAFGVPDVTSHSFRKSLATLIDEEGLSARIGADHLGHARVSETQDTYMARGRVHTQVADLLDRHINDE